MANDVILDRILGSVIPVLIIVMIGYLYGRWRKPNMSTINQVNMELFVPMLIFFGLGIEVSRSHRLSSADDRDPWHHSRVCRSDLANLSTHRHPTQNINSTHDVYQYWQFGPASCAVSFW